MSEAELHSDVLPAAEHEQGSNGARSDLDVVRRAEQRGFDPVRVALALGVDLQRLSPPAVERTSG